MKKILIINTSFKKGGAARVARDIFDASISRFDVYFAYGRGKRENAAKVKKFGHLFETLMHIFLVRFLGLEGWGSYFSTHKLIKFIKKEKFDLIHLHNLHGYYLNFFTLVKFLQKEKIPVIWTLHDEWPITWLPAHSLGCEHCKTSIGKCSNTYAYPKNYLPIFAKYMLKKKKEIFGGGWRPVIVCPSKWLADNVAKSFLGKFEIKVINNGVDTELFKPAADMNQLRTQYDLSQDKKIIIFSASNLNDKSKGLDCILNVAKRLADKSYLFLCIGAGKLEEFDNIKHFGYIYDKNKFAEVLSCGDLFCFTSSAETFLLSAAEALSCGVPVVGFDLPVVREIINTDVGVLVAPGNETEFEKALIGLLDNNQDRIAKGANGRKLIVNNYSQQLFIQKYHESYQNI